MSAIAERHRTDPVPISHRHIRANLAPLEPGEYATRPLPTVPCNVSSSAPVTHNTLSAMSAHSSFRGHRHLRAASVSVHPSVNPPVARTLDMSGMAAASSNLKPHSRIPGAKIQYPVPLQVYYEQRTKVASETASLSPAPIVLEFLPGEPPRIMDLRPPPVPPSPSAFPTIMACLQTPSEANFSPQVQPPSAAAKHKLVQKDSRPDRLPLAHPFPKPSARPAKEDRTVRPVLPVLPKRVVTGREFEDARHEDQFYFNNISDYGHAVEDCEKAFKEEDVEAVRAASERMVAASKLARKQMLDACSEELRMSIHVQRNVQEIETWEVLIESHCSKTRKDARPDEVKPFLRMGRYLVGHLGGSNADFARLMDSEYSARMRRPAEFADASLPLEYDDAALKELHERIKKGKSKGFLARLVDQAMALKKDSSAKRKLPDVASYARASPSESDEPIPKVEMAPEYFDEYYSGPLYDICLSLRAAVIAFHLVARHYRATGEMAPIPQYGNYMSTNPLIDDADLPTLIRHLTDHFEDVRPQSIALMDAFFHFFRYITTPSRLLQLLLDRYHEKPPKSLSREDNLEWRARHIFTKLFVVRMIALWLDRYYLACEDKAILPEINSFTFKYVAEDQDLPPKASWLIAVQLCECHAGRRGVTYIPVLGHAIVVGKEEVRSYPATPFQKHLPVWNRLEQDGRLGATDILFFQQQGGAEEIARALTRFEALRFQNLQRSPADLILWQPDAESPWITQAERFSKALNLWTSLCVIDHEFPAERAKAYEVLVEVAYICWKMRNFSSTFAITLGLVATRVRRLTETMKLVSKAHHLKAKELRAFVESEDYSAYRNEMSSYIGPTVPLHAVVRADLKKLYETGSIKALFKGGDEKSPIDFNTLRGLGHIIRDLESCLTPYKVPVLAVVWEFLKLQIFPLETCKARDFVDGLEQLSRIREPSIPQKPSGPNTHRRTHSHS